MEFERFIPEHLSKGTKGLYRVNLNRFLNTYLEGKVSIEQLLDEARKDVTKTQARIDGYYRWLLTDRQTEEEKTRKLKKNSPLKESSAFIAAYGYLKGFFSNYDIAFQKKWSKTHKQQEGENEAIANDDIHYSFFSPDKEGKAIQFNTEAMRDFLLNMNPRDQAITLALLSSGQDSGDLFSLTVGFVREQSKEGKVRERLFWSGRRGKTHILFRTFISKEATTRIRKYLEQERKGANDKDPLFVTNDGNPMTPNYLGWLYRDIAKKMNVEWDNDEQNPLRAKRLRHVFRTACDAVGMNELYENCFMGHKNHMGQRYSSIAPAILEVQYLKVEPLLTVFTGSGKMMDEEELAKAQVEITKLQTTVDVITEQLEALRRRSDEQNERIKQLHEFMDKKVEDVTKKLFDKWMEEQQEAMNQSE